MRGFELSWFMVFLFSVRVYFIIFCRKKMTIIDVDFLCDIYDLSMCERSK